MPFLPPASDPLETELECALIFYPNREEYRRALFGAYLDLENRFNWEASDADKEDIFTSWHAAILETFAALGKLDDILTALDYIAELVDEVEPLLRQQQPCCDLPPGSYYDPGDLDLSGSGDVPQPVIDSGYADDAADWEGYNAYKCMAAHVFLDGYKAMLLALEPFWTAGTLLLGTLIAIASILAPLPAIKIVGVTVGISEILAALGFIKELGPIALEDVVDTIEENRDDIVCAMVQADGVDAVVQAFRDKMDELFSDAIALVLKNLNVKSIIYTYMAGAYGDADAAQALADAGYDPGDYECCPEIYTAYGNIAQVTPDNGFEIGEEIGLGQPLEFTSYMYGAGHYEAWIYLINLTSSGPLAVLDTCQIYLDAISGWSSYSTIDKQLYITNGSSPWYTASTEYDWSPGSLPELIVNSSNGCGVRIRSSTPFTMTIRFEDPGE